MENKRLAWENSEALKLAIKAVGEGKVGVGDTDTVPGLFAACTANGVAQLNAIKERSDKPYLVLLGSKDAVYSLVKQPISSQIEKLIENYWPGPLTLVLSAQEDVPEYLQSKHGGIAVRIPEDPYVREFAHRCGGVLSTSANFTGKPTPISLEELDPRIIQMAAFILYHTEQKRHDKPSTILDVTGDRIRIIREGAISVEELEALLQTSFIR